MAQTPDTDRRRPDQLKTQFTVMPATANLYKRLDWFNCFWLIAVPTFGFISAAYTPLQVKTAIWAVVYYFITGLGITAGYHRLWAHRSYTASLPLRIWLAVASSGACEDSIQTWCADHRAHHRYTDTDKDPYSVKKGLLYSHIGWLVMKQDPKRRGKADISDLLADPVITWQHNHYMEIAMFMGFLFPSCVGGLGWGDWWGSFIYVGILRTFFVQQASFCVNSLAHWLGDQAFDDKLSPRDHIITALMSLGEGYHNFHHEFPVDYRNGIFWHQYDPTKWLIWVCQQLGLAQDLKTFRQNEIEKGRLQQEQKKLNEQQMRLDRKKSQIQWPVPLDQLPVMEWDDYQEQATSRHWIAIAGVVYAVSDFVEHHPGGENFINSHIGKDATTAFNGGVYNHSNAAHNFLSTMRVGVIRGGCEVEIWKRGGGDIEKIEPVAVNNQG